MPLIIDGYNLLNESGVFGRGPSTLERARQALLRFLANTLPADELVETTVVFDAKEAPPGLPRSVNMYGIRVRYAAEYQEADDLIERLIRNNTSPRQLMVVSSDHRIQRAARRRKCRAADSSVWLDQQYRQHRDRKHQQEAHEPKPGAPLPKEEVESWMKEFGEVDLATLAPSPLRPSQLRTTDDTTGGPGRAMSPENSAKTESASPGEPEGGETHDARSQPETEKPSGDFWNPFPPGYAEDLWEENGPKET